jgi:ApbE superfamily uncharacterized protein (UPF0280 family)
MSYEKYIGVIDEAGVLAECGPMRLVIRAWNQGQPQIALARQAADEAFGCLERIAGCRSPLSRPWLQIADLPADQLAHRMIGSVKSVGDDDLTPMAAVAGTIADAVADWLFERHPTKIIVDNGGDIAVRLAPGETAVVGIRPKINSLDISHVINLDDRRSSWGVTTSGIGGRSFTRGIASAVTVIAGNASIADAAATAVANACFVEDSHIAQVPAEQIDPNTDLKGVKVTVNVGMLSHGKKVQAVQAACTKASSLCRKQLIIGALIVLEDVFLMTKGMEEFISPSN